MKERGVLPDHRDSDTQAEKLSACVSFSQNADLKMQDA